MSRLAMFALGCLALIVLPLIGFIAGLFLAGQGAGLWGAGIGLLAAIAMSGTAALALIKASAKR
jgi:hypothetical protein